MLQCDSLAASCLRLLLVEVIVAVELCTPSEDRSRVCYAKTEASEDDDDALQSDEQPLVSDKFASWSGISALQLCDTVSASDEDEYDCGRKEEDENLELLRQRRC